MSRSVKKHPVCTDGRPGTTKRSKRCANKRVRNVDFEELPTKGKGYRKVFETYDIHDWINRWTKEEAIKDWEKAKERRYWEGKTFRDYINYWEKCCLRK